MKIFYPVVWIVNSFAHILLYVIRIDSSKIGHNQLDKDELKSIIADADSLMPSRYQKMLVGIL
jgi:Mg2+/Co2+ transporter CorB